MNSNPGQRGLHHLARLLDNCKAIAAIQDRMNKLGIKVEFPPEILVGCPAKHLMCYGSGEFRV